MKEAIREFVKEQERATAELKRSEYGPLRILGEIVERYESETEKGPDGLPTNLDICKECGAVRVIEVLRRLPSLDHPGQTQGPYCGDCAISIELERSNGTLIPKADSAAWEYFALEMNFQAGAPQLGLVDEIGFNGSLDATIHVLQKCFEEIDIEGTLKLFAQHGWTDDEKVLEGLKEVNPF